MTQKSDDQQFLDEVRHLIEVGDAFKGKNPDPNIIYTTDYYKKLIAIIQTLQAENDRLQEARPIKCSCGKLYEAGNIINPEIARLKAENERMREALEFYSSDEIVFPAGIMTRTQFNQYLELRDIPAYNHLPDNTSVAKAALTPNVLNEGEEK